MLVLSSINPAHCSIISLGVLTDATADLAVTLLLATARRVSEAMQTVRVSDDRTLAFSSIRRHRMVNGVARPISCGCAANL